MTDSDLCSRGRQVLQLEAEALAWLSNNLPQAFAEVCHLILECKGRVVVSGMGKAGIIGQKLSATLASTGTPSLFLHPSEALHGDLGRMRPSDVILTLSNSGETKEIVRLLPAIKAIGAKSVAICGANNSKLALNSDFFLEIGTASEACPLGLAPTVSTTAMLGLGDALAMAVLELRKFTREEFARFHPAGSLGKELMLVCEIMRQGKHLPLIESGTSLRQALSVMTTTPGRPGAALVVNPSNELLGIFTDGDLRRLAEDGQLPLDEATDNHMAQNPRFLEDNLHVSEALRLFKDLHVDQMPVLCHKSQKVVGLVDVQDLIEVRI
ncbi:MAG: KpsF/GutQ family sugar-phosphate isomerase [Planctomycetota bacterium]|jgi:arabinose-5-phosphate isomerase|nr:KpsF/GutQ family sugar-phosphate isomerase [Planctomycetota bacterium]